MNLIRRTGTILMIAAALSLPTLASAEQPSELCEGSKADHKQPTAENTTKVNTQKSDAKASEKSEQKQQQADKPAPDQSNRS